jgi:hypothetical protein
LRHRVRFQVGQMRHGLETIFPFGGEHIGTGLWT